MASVITGMIKRVVKSGIGAYRGLSGPALTKDMLTVFLYHDVSDTPSLFSRNYHLNVRPEVFDFQMRFIKSRFNVIGPDELIDAKLPPNAAMITFDDGFKGVFTNAAPILEKHRIPATVFLNMATVRGEVLWAGLLNYLCDFRKDFVEKARAKLADNVNGKPLYLSCPSAMVRSYMSEAGASLEKDVRAYTGALADEQDVLNASGGDTIFFGNHLFRHEVALLMSDDELVASYRENELALMKYPNSRPLFAFPFGKPGTCFSDRQVDLLLRQGASKVFSAYSSMNPDRTAPYLHRQSLDDGHNSPSLMWYRIMKAYKS